MFEIKTTLHFLNIAFSCVFCISEKIFKLRFSQKSLFLVTLVCLIRMAHDYYIFCFWSVPTFITSLASLRSPSSCADGTAAPRVALWATLLASRVEDGACGPMQRASTPALSGIPGRIWKECRRDCPSFIIKMGSCLLTLNTRLLGTSTLYN